VFPRRGAAAGEENVELVEGVLFEVVGEQIELEQCAEDLLVLALDVVEELAHDRWRKLALDAGQLAMDPVELSLELVELRGRVDGAVDPDLVDDLFQSLVEGLKVVCIGHGPFVEVLKDPAEELVEGPQRSEAVGQCGIPNAQGMRLGSLHHLRIHRLAVTYKAGGTKMLGQTVVSREEIESMIDRLASELEADLEGKAPVFIGVLKGCVFFLTDLTRRIGKSVELDFIQVSSYGASTTSSGSVVLVKDITVDVRDRDVYLVEDIVDTGITLTDVIKLIEARHPRSIQVVALLSKPSRRQIEVGVAFLGTEIEDLFVVGYGLDYGEAYRNLPDIRVLEES
jgi:hypoxanthine phosphoribosyltransferase